jgi:Holliday junction resolvase RusA-like endonuclease
MISYDLPLPPSVNSMFANRGVKGAFDEARKANRIGQARPAGRVKTASYREWRRQAGLHLLMQGPLQRIAGPVCIHVTITDRACGDLDNRLKAVLDLLVKHQIIEDDKKDIVRSIYMEWGDVSGARIEITPATDWVTRKNLAQVAG